MKLILHIGTHKTGTTTIQNILSINRDQLSKQGLYYPDCRPVFDRTVESHRLFANSLANYEYDGLVKAKKFVDYIFSMNKSDSTIIISAEQFYRHVSGKDWWGGDLVNYWDLRREYIETVANVLRDFEVNILMCLREKKSFQESLYHQLIKKEHFSGDMEKFLNYFAPMFDYENQINLTNDVFGSVQIYSYEYALRNGLAATFFQKIGFDMPYGANQIWKNKTP